MGKFTCFPNKTWSNWLGLLVVGNLGAQAKVFPKLTSSTACHVVSSRRPIRSSAQQEAMSNPHNSSARGAARALIGRRSGNKNKNKCRSCPGFWFPLGDFQNYPPVHAAMEPTREMIPFKAASFSRTPKLQGRKGMGALAPWGVGESEKVFRTEGTTGLAPQTGEGGGCSWWEKLASKGRVLTGGTRRKRQRWLNSFMFVFGDF